jgi:hypothetical protein
MTKQAILEHVLDQFLTSKQIAQIKDGWNAFYNEPLRYRNYADMVKQFLIEKNI